MARDTRLRVAIATPSYPPDLGGLGNHVHDLAAALADLGCAVSVMSQFSTRVKARPPLIERYSENLTVRGSRTGSAATGSDTLRPAAPDNVEHQRRRLRRAPTPSAPTPRCPSR